MLATRLLDGTEGALSRAGAWLSRPGAMRACVALLVILAIVVRLPLAATANDVPSGHNDANIYFNQVYAHWLHGNFYPDFDRGSGWQMLLYVTLASFDVPGGAWVEKNEALTGETAHAALLAYVLSAMLSAGIVVGAYVVARQLVGPLATLGVLVLVAFDPYLLFTSHSAMSEPPYTALLLFAIAATLKARTQPLWLLPVGALMAAAHVMRVNGLVMFVMILAFAALVLPRGKRARWIAASVLVFALVAAPYLVWRDVAGPGAFDYGTNQRFWADDLWDMTDRYWTERNAGVAEPHKETMGEYLATHTLREATQRFVLSIQWQVFDLTGAGKWPPLQAEGGAWPGTPPDGAALTPLLVGLALVAALTTRRRELLFIPLAIAFTLATFVWIYPLVRSVRYFAPLIPLVIIAAIVGWNALADRIARPALAATALFAGYVALYGTNVLLHVPEGFALLAQPDVGALILTLTAFWLAIAFLPEIPALAGAFRRRVPADDEEVAE